MLRKRFLPDQAELQRVFRYDKTTGVLYWRVRYDWPKECNTRFANRPAGGLSPDGYIQVVAFNNNWGAHQIIYKLVYGVEPAEVDHKDNNGQNNLLSNLRAADRARNGWNQGLRKNNKTGVKGLFRNASGRWYGQIDKLGKTYQTKYSKDRTEIVEALTKLRTKLHGEFANHGAVLSPVVEREIANGQRTT